MDNLFFVLSKVLWELLNPQTLTLLLLLIATLWLWIGKAETARKLITAITITVALISFIPFNQWLLYPLETRFNSNPELPDQIDGIIILGGSVIRETSEYWQQIETNDKHERLAYGVMLALQYPEARLVFSGGIGGLDQNQPSEAEFAERYLLAHGIDDSRIVIERRSRNTYENALFTQQLINPEPTQQWLLITSAYHMPRSVGVFCQVGWSVLPFPVDHHSNPEKLFTPYFNFIDNAGSLLMVFKEWVGLAAYYFKGNTSTLFPQSCGQSN